MQPYKYIVFDFDGTIADSRELFISLYNTLAEKNGYVAMTKDNLQQLRGMSIAQRCKMLNVPLYKIPFIASAIIKQYKGAVTGLEFNPGMKGLLESLIENEVPFAVLSSNSKENIEQFLDYNGIECTDVFSSRSVFGKHILINKFLKYKQLKPEEILYVGDELRDVIACQKCGVPVAWVSWGYDSIESLEKNKPDYQIDNPAQVLALALGQRVIV